MSARVSTDVLLVCVSANVNVHLDLTDGLWVEFPSHCYQCVSGDLRTLREQGSGWKLRVNCS